MSTPYTTLVLLFVMLWLSNIFATEQMDDILYYEGAQLGLATGWGHPSPLQTYYFQNEKEYPFKMWHTANYRGHVATWIIQNDSLILKEVMADSIPKSPRLYGILSASSANTSADIIFADWFSGIIAAHHYKSKKTGKIDAFYFFQVHNGLITAKQPLDDKALKEFWIETNKKQTPRTILQKYPLLFLNQHYRAYYFQLREDEIVINGEKCLLQTGAQKLSPIFSIFKNDHLSWPYNWERIDTSGAPNCTWVVDSSRIYLQVLRLHQGTSFEGPESIVLDIPAVTGRKMDSNRLSADWVNGVYIIKHGEMKSDKGSMYKYFHPSKITLVRFKDGTIVKQIDVSKDFNFTEPPKGISGDLKELIEDL